jgi:hypothetical protein
MKVSLLLPCVAALAALPHQNTIFEPEPRVIAAGRDPVMAVRASGAISLLKVEERDLWLSTSFDGGDSFEQRVRVNDVAGEVSSHLESSPRLCVRSRGEFYVVWQTRISGADSSKLRFTRSLNWGESFMKAVDIDASQRTSSQSFYTMNVAPNGNIYVAWLDARDRGKGRPGTSAVYIAKSQDRGVSFTAPVRVSLESCPCCRPSIAFTGEQSVHVAWRRVMEANVRDIFVSTSEDGGSTWKEPVRVAEDNWRLDGCPHSGAATAVMGKRLFVSWATVREGKAQLYLAFSDDSGNSFSPRTTLAESVVDPNHPYLAAVGDRLAVAFQGRDPGQNRGWGLVNAYYREIHPSGNLSKLENLGNAGRSASYPNFTYEEPGRVFVTWSESEGDARKVVLARGRRTSTGVSPRGKRVGAEK